MLPRRKAGAASILRGVTTRLRHLYSGCLSNGSGPGLPCPEAEIKAMGGKLCREKKLCFQPRTWRCSGPQPFQLSAGGGCKRAGWG